MQRTFPALALMMLSSISFAQSGDCKQYYKQKAYDKAFAACQLEAQDVGAQLILGKMYSIGIDVDPDYIKAVQYFTLAANQNNPEAQFLMALCYQNGLGVPQDFAMSLYWYQNAVKHGLDAPAIPPSIARGPQKIKKVSYQNDTQALEQAAHSNHTQAQYQLGMQYVLGENIAQDDASAAKWLQLAAQKDHQAAQSYLAWMNAIGLGKPQNLHEAIAWYVKARRQPLFELEDDLELDVFDDHLYTPQEIKAQFERGVALLEGHFEKPDVAPAIALIQLAAKHNLDTAQAYLAKLYQSGDHIKKDPHLALKWYQKAAKNGNLEAQYRLGWLYFYGEGIDKDPVKAYRLFKQASNKGSVPAQNAVSLVYSQLSPEQRKSIK